MDNIFLGLIGALFGGALSLAGAVFVSRREFIRKSRIEAAEILSPLASSVSSENWPRARQGFGRLISKGWALGVKEQLLIDRARSVFNTLTRWDAETRLHTDPGSPLTEEQEQWKSDLLRHLQDLRKLLHERILGRSYAEFQLRRDSGL
ncbi:MAG: hypothetical protein WEA29_09035 [Acidimicrobiia bacterium]